MKDVPAVIRVVASRARQGSSNLFLAITVVMRALKEHTTRIAAKRFARIARQVASLQRVAVLRVPSVTTTVQRGSSTQVAAAPALASAMRAIRASSSALLAQAVVQTVLRVDSRIRAARRAAVTVPHTLSSRTQGRHAAPTATTCAPLASAIQLAVLQTRADALTARADASAWLCRR